jgi:hypothetical protein
MSEPTPKREVVVRHAPTCIAQIFEDGNPSIFAPITCTCGAYRRATQRPGNDGIVKARKT